MGRSTPAGRILGRARRRSAKRPLSCWLRCRARSVLPESPASHLPSVPTTPASPIGPNDRSIPHTMCPFLRAGRPWGMLTVLELGSGTGAGGLATALLGSREVTLTDQRHPVFAAEVKVTLLLHLPSSCRGLAAASDLVQPATVHTLTAPHALAHGTAHALGNQHRMLT